MQGVVLAPLAAEERYIDGAWKLATCRRRAGSTPSPVALTTVTCRVGEATKPVSWPTDVGVRAVVGEVGLLGLLRLLQVGGLLGLVRLDDRRLDAGGDLGGGLLALVLQVEEAAGQQHDAGRRWRRSPRGCGRSGP